MGGRSTPEDGGIYEPPRPLRPGLLVASSLGLLVFALLLSNGRPIDAGDTRPTERVAKSLVERFRLDLDDQPDVAPPFSRSAGGHRVSIYPVLSAVMAAPVFALGRLLFALDEVGLAFCGKLAASAFASLAAVLLFLTLAPREGESSAASAALLFALGTSLCSTSQALWQHPAACLFITWALFELARGEDDPALSRAGLPLSLAVAARHADAALVLGLVGGIAVFWPRRLPLLLLWALPGALFVAVYDTLTFGSPWTTGFSDAAARFNEPWGLGQLGLLVSPGKGLFVYTPLALCGIVGLVKAYRSGDRPLPVVCAVGFLAHLLLTGRWSEWHGGESFGPRLMTDALPLLFFFLPAGLAACGRLGLVAAFVSVLAQGIGAFTFDDYRWERLYQRPSRPGHPELWNPTLSPLLYYLERRVVIVALPVVQGGRMFIRTAPFVLFGPSGSRIRFAGQGPEVRGSDPTFEDVYLQNGARVEGSRLELKGRWDGLFLRVRGPARLRKLELRVVGYGSGMLYVGERTFWSTAPVWTAYPVSGSFRVVHPYSFPDSGGGDIVVTVGKNGGDLSVGLVALVPPGEPDQVIEAP
jgi:hypothetical protein